MNLTTIKSPGVYTSEVNAFPNSVVAIPTAVPAFIGYTPQASYEGKSYTNVALKISSFVDFQEIFCLPNPPAPSNPAKQYTPQYYVIQQKSQPASGDYMTLNGNYYSVLPDPNTIYYLYNSIRLFYANGGGDAYIISVGSYGAPSGKPITSGTQIVNSNVKLSDLLGGLKLLQNEEEPTMYIIPEATLLSPVDNGTLMQAMLQQSLYMQTSISIFDIIGGNNPDPLMYTNDIANFRKSTGNTGLCYGAAYYPFIGTSIMQDEEIDYTNLFGGDVTQLASIINPPSNPDPNVSAILANILDPAGGTTLTQNNEALLNASQTYNRIMRDILNAVNILPPSGAIAGIITSVDKQAGGPWVAPANKSIKMAVSLPVNLNDAPDAALNVDVVTGKSTNAIRGFEGEGILVWGAGTLDGNNKNFKDLRVRRLVTFLKQSCKLIAHKQVFQPNTEPTWSAIISDITTFLTSIWKAGGLKGATPEEAFSVACGLGTTMTADDILNGFLNLTVQVAVVQPAEFIVISFQQEMPTS